MSASAAVLIVEDERIVAKDLQKSLLDMGYDAFAIASSAEEALSCASAKNPDVVLMDIRIKGPTDGIQTAALLKERFPVIVIYLTAHADEAMLNRAKPTDPAGYLVKPIKSVDLRSMIEISLHQRDAHHQRERVRRLEKQLFTITANVPIAIAYFDNKNHVRFANSIFCGLVPYQDNPIGVSAMAFLGETLFRQSYPAREKASVGESSRFTIDVQPDGRPRRYEMTFLPDHDELGNVDGIYTIGYDVTEREQLTRDLARTRHDLETILNAVPASITSWDRDLTNRFANSAACSRWRALGARKVDRSMSEAMGEHRFEQVRPLLKQVLAGRKCTGEQIEEQADGVHYWRSEYLPEMENGEPVGLYILSFDITEIRRSHEQIRQLAQRLEAVREEERRAVATILHDGIAQDLFALKLEISHGIPDAQKDQRLALFCQNLEAAVIKCMEEIRQLANELRPISLSSVGIAEVIADHARQFAQRAGLTVTVNHSPGFPQLSEPVRLLLFRAAQEALTNVARHARATTVEISFQATSSQIIMEVADDGIGMTDADLRKSKSLGLLALRERVVAMGWELTLAPHEPRGTRLILTVPHMPRLEGDVGS